jgi:WD40 repeat protein/acylphosphatase
MSKEGIIAVVRAGSRGEPNVEDAYEIRFSNRGMRPLPLDVRPTAIAAYEGALAGTAMSDAAGQPFLLGFEDGSIGIVWHDTGHSVHIVQGAVPARSGAALRPVFKLASTGNHIASVDSDGAITLWAVDNKSGRPVVSKNFTRGVEDLRLSTGGGGIYFASFSPDGKRVVTASADNTARLLDAETGKPIGAPLVGHENAVLSAAFSPDGKRIVTASADKTARLWDAESGKQIGPPLVGHEHYVISAAFSPDGKRIATASADKTARLWDAESGAEIGAPLVGHEDIVNSAAFSPDGKLIVTASEDKTARLWDASTGKEIAILRGHNGAVSTASFSPDGRNIVTASLDGTVRVWDASTGKEIAILRGHNGAVSTASFSPDGKRIVTASEDKTARLWDASTGKEIAILRGHNGAVSTASFSPDGRNIVTASLDGTVRVWDASTRMQIAVLRDDNGAETRCQGCKFLDIDETTNTIEVVDSLGRDMRFSTVSGQRVYSRSIDQPVDGTVFFDRLHHSILTSRNDGTVSSTATGDLPAHSALVSHTTFLRDGRIVTGAIDGSVRIINPIISTWINRLDLGQDSLKYCFRFAEFMREATKRKKAISGAVMGNVQTVGFRAIVMKQAIEYNLAGSAKNERNVVRFTLQGDADRIDTAIAAIREGTRKPSNIEISATDVSVDAGLNTFTIPSWTSVDLNIATPYDLVFKLRSNDGKISKGEANEVWDEILKSTLGGDDLKKFLAAD